MRRPNRTQAELRIPDGAGDIVMANRGLIATAFKTYFPWIAKQCRHLREDFEAIALFSLAKAARDHDPAKGKYSTVAITYIRNDVLNEVAKHKRVKWMRTDDFSVAIDKDLSPHMQAVMSEAIHRACTPGMFEESDDESN